MKYLGYTVATLAYLVLGALWRGWVLCQLWLWFMVPTFSLPALSVPAAIGLSLIVGYMAKDVEPKTDDRPFGTQLLQMGTKAFLSPLLALGIGAVVQLYL